MAEEIKLTYYEARPLTPQIKALHDWADAVSRGPKKPKMARTEKELKDFYKVGSPRYTDEYAARIADRRYAPELIKDHVAVTSYVAEQMGLMGLIFRGQFSMGKTVMFDNLVHEKIMQFAKLGDPYPG